MSLAFPPALRLIAGYTGEDSAFSTIVLTLILFALFCYLITCAILKLEEHNYKLNYFLADFKDFLKERNLNNILSLIDDLEKAKNFLLQGFRNNQDYVSDIDEYIVNPSSGELYALERAHEDPSLSEKFKNIQFTNNNLDNNDEKEIEEPSIEALTLFDTIIETCEIIEEQIHEVPINIKVIQYAEEKGLGDASMKKLNKNGKNDSKFNTKNNSTRKNTNTVDKSALEKSAKPSQNEPSSNSHNEDFSDKQFSNKLPSQPENDIEVEESYIDEMLSLSKMITDGSSESYDVPSPKLTSENAVSDEILLNNYIEALNALGNSPTQKSPETEEIETISSSIEKTTPITDSLEAISTESSIEITESPEIISNLMEQEDLICSESVDAQYENELSNINGFINVAESILSISKNSDTVSNDSHIVLKQATQNQETLNPSLILKDEADYIEDIFEDNTTSYEETVENLSHDSDESSYLEGSSYHPTSYNTDSFDNSHHDIFALKNINSDNTNEVVPEIEKTVIIEKPNDSDIVFTGSSVDIIFEENIEETQSPRSCALVEFDFIYTIDSLYETEDEIPAKLIPTDLDKIVDKNTEIDTLIDMAFTYKMQKNHELAIFTYMEALKRIDDHNLSMLIIIDICSIYKELGQSDFAKFILEDFKEKYKKVIDASIIKVIEDNLL